MATVYNFQVKCVSAFVAHGKEKIKSIIIDSLKNFVDQNTGLKLESIEVKEVDYVNRRLP